MTLFTRSNYKLISTNYKARLVSGYDYDFVAKALQEKKITEGETALLRLINFGLFDWYGSDAAMTEMQAKGWVEKVETPRLFAFSITDKGMEKRKELFERMMKL